MNLKVLSISPHVAWNRVAEVAVAEADGELSLGASPSITVVVNKFLEVLAPRFSSVSVFQILLLDSTVGNQCCGVSCAIPSPPICGGKQSIGGAQHLSLLPQKSTISFAALNLSSNISETSLFAESASRFDSVTLEAPSAKEQIRRSN